MKRINILLAFVATIAVMSSCTEEYFYDTDVHVDQYDGTTWEYLQSKPEHFSELVELIKTADMVDVFQNQTITMFPPKNATVIAGIRTLNRRLASTGLDTLVQYSDIKPEVWREFLGLYVVAGRYELKDIPQVDTITYTYRGQDFKSLNGRSMNIGLLYNSAGGVQYAGYRQLIYAYIHDFSEPQVSRRNYIVATANQKTTNGVVHVLQAYERTFPFDFATFYERVTTVGFVDNSN